MRPDGSGSREKGDVWILVWRALSGAFRRWNCLAGITVTWHEQWRKSPVQVAHLRVSRPGIVIPAGGTARTAFSRDWRVRYYKGQFARPIVHGNPGLSRHAERRPAGRTASELFFSRMLNPVEEE